MYDVVKIGEKEVPMLAMASVDLYYKAIFGEDAIKAQISEDENSPTALEIITKMGFIMAKFAECKSRKEMLKLNAGDCFEWLDGFDRGEFLEAIGDIRRVYNGEKVTDSEEKKQYGE